jgi:DNA-binding LytR/AlgR family response regulator
MEIEIRIDKDTEKTKVIIITREMDENVQDLVGKIQGTGKKKVAGYLDDLLYLLDPVDINYFFAQNQNVFAKTDQKTYRIKKRLFELETDLMYAGFLRVSNGVVANMDRLRNLEMTLNGTILLKFMNGDVEYSSRRYAVRIKEFLQI